MSMRIAIRGLTLCAICAVGLVACREVAAQQSSMFGGNSQGTQASSQLGAQSMLNTGSIANVKGGNGGGATGLGLTNSNQAGANGAAGQGQVGMAGNSGRFIGNNLAGQNGGANKNQANQGNRGMNNQRGNRNNQNQQPGMQNNQNSGANMKGKKSALRPQLRVAFNAAKRSPAALATSVDTRFQKLSRRAEFQKVEAAHVDGQVVLRGEVATPEARRLAGMIASLEPGVRSVKNEIVVKSAAPATESQ